MKINRTSIAIGVTVFALATSAGSAQNAGSGPDDVVHFKPMSSGAMKKMGGYRPQRLTLSAEKPATLTKAPDGLTAPMYGVLPIGSAAEGKGAAPVYHVILDEPEGKDATLYVDSNGNGDLTDDGPAEWTSKPVKGQDEKEYKQYGGGATIQLGTGEHAFPAHLGMYRFDKTDPARAPMKDMILYYADYASEGKVTLGGKSYTAMLTDDLTTGDFRGRTGDEQSGVRLMLDVNGNGKFDVRGETFDARKPFNIGGTTYEIADLTATGDSFKIVKSSQAVAEVPLPPDHSVGKPITAFEVKMMDGKTVKFPGDYKGKIVMLDFWATWCGPCMGEVPGLVEVYNKFHGAGFDVLGISLDQKDSADKVKSVTGEHGMTWPQVYDGKFWDAEIAQMYVIRGIPAAFLVDGDTGKIVAAGGSLRGDSLDETVKKALEQKKAAAPK